MSDLDVPLPVVILLLLLFAILAATAARGDIAEDCKTLGAFRRGAVVYQCKEVGKT